MKIILASKSPRRQEILKNLGVEFICEPVDADESIEEGKMPCDAVSIISQRKAILCLENHKGESDVFVISADTVVVIDGKIIGKPKDKEDAFNTLRTLSGRSHDVFTGFTLATQDKIYTKYVKTEVFFRELSDDEINTYISCGEPFDKAGSYGVQGKGATFVKSLCGDFFNVVGLPVCELCVCARTVFGIDLTK